LVDEFWLNWTLVQPFEENLYAGPAELLFILTPTNPSLNETEILFCAIEVNELTTIISDNKKSESLLV
jgi:hypothetical protein